MTVMEKLPTAGGAQVEIFPRRFIGWDPAQPNREREIDGFGWECQGCGADPGPRSGYVTVPDARRAADRHAANCRRRPKAGGR